MVKTVALQFYINLNLIFYVNSLCNARFSLLSTVILTWQIITFPCSLQRLTFNVSLLFMFACKWIFIYRLCLFLDSVAQALMYFKTM